MVNYDRKPLDPSLYSLDSRLAKLYKRSTGIQDDTQLKAHILSIQSEAYDTYPYPCIRLMTFTKLSITEVPLYNDIIRQGRKRSDAILLEIGVGFGNDIRKVVDDGYPIQNIVVTDINPDLWEIGHRLFRSDFRSFPIKFVQGDIFDDQAFSIESQPSPYRPDLGSLPNLTPLKGHVTTICLQMVFHLFDLEHQSMLARRIAQLLSSSPGSMIVGRQMGSISARELLLQGDPHYLHNPDSWERMWSKIFPGGGVEYLTALVDLPPDLMASSKDMLGVTQFLTWSIRTL